MIGIYLRPEDTQVVKLVKRKKTLKVVAAKTLPSFYEAFREKDVAGLTKMFHKIGEAVGGAYEGISLSLPSDCFLLDCADSTGMDEEEKRWFEAHTARKYEAYYCAFPVRFKARVQQIKSVAALKKEYVDVLLLAAESAGSSLVSVEAAGISYLRALDRWKEEVCLLEVFEDRAGFVSYSPVAGVFRLPAPRLSGKGWTAKAVADAVLENDAICKRTFQMVNLNVPIHVLSAKELSLPQELNGRRPAPPFPPVGVAVDEKTFLAFQVPIGAAMQDVEMESLHLLPAYLTIGSANVLPPDIRLEGRLTQLKRRVKRTAKWVFVLLAMLLAAEVAGIWYYSSFVITPSLQAEYDEANKALPNIKRELEIIKKAGNEHQYPVKALNSLLCEKPAGIWFAGVEIGQGKDWVRLSVKAKDAMAFQNYQNALSKNPVFKDIRISHITSDERNGLKNALFTIGRGKG